MLFNRDKIFIIVYKWNIMFYCNSSNHTIHCFSDCDSFSTKLSIYICG